MRVINRSLTVALLASSAAFAQSGGKPLAMPPPPAGTTQKPAKALEMPPPPPGAAVKPAKALEMPPPPTATKPASTSAPAAATAVKPEMPPPPPGMQKKLPPLRVALFDINVVGEVPPRPLAVLNAALAPELRKLEGVSAISAAEVRDMISAERQKQLMGCGDEAESCLAEIAGALDADEVINVEIALVGTNYTLSARRSDMRRARVVQSQSRRFAKGDGEELLGVVGPLIEALYPDRPLRAGKKRGIEEQVVRKLNPPPLPKWVFFSTAGGTAVALAGGATFGLLSQNVATDLRQKLSGATGTNTISAAQVTQLQSTANDHAFVANVMFGVAGAFALGAGLEALFTDWNDDRAALAVTPVAGAGGGGGVIIGGTF